MVFGKCRVRVESVWIAVPVKNDDIQKALVIGQAESPL